MEVENKENMYNVNYVLNDIVLKQIEIDKNIFLRVIKKGDEKFIDISKFYANKPTKKSIRFPYKSLKEIRNSLDNV